MVLNKKKEQTLSFLRQSTFVLSFLFAKYREGLFLLMTILL